MSYEVPSAGTAGHPEFDLSNPAVTFLDTTTRVIRQPARFFEQLPPHAGYLNPAA